MPGGRPTSYRPEYAQMLIDYFDQAQAFERIIDEATGKVTNLPNKFPTLWRFACNIGVHSETLGEWARAEYDDGTLKFPEFSEAFKKAVDYQKSILVEGAIGGAFAPAFSIFFAKNNFGWKDKTEVDQKVTIEDARPTTLLEDARRAVFLLAMAEAEQAKAPKLKAVKAA